MQWSFRVGRVGATDIKIHGSFILIVAYVLFVTRPDTLRDTLFPLLLLAVLFACVTLHEIGHTLMARRFGIGVRSIILWPLGGFAMMSREPGNPIHQILIAAAGPLVNGVIALIMQLATHTTLAFVIALAKRDLGTFDTFFYTRSMLDFVVSANSAPHVRYRAEAELRKLQHAHASHAYSAEPLA